LPILIKGVTGMKIKPAHIGKGDLHELFMSAIVPRPIALVSTVGEDGVFNLAPFSCFTSLCLKPALVGLQFGWKRSGEKKDTLRNIEFSKDFVVNVVGETLAQAMNQASGNYPSDVDEFKEVGLTSVESDLVKAPRVAESPVHMECRLKQILEFGEAPTGSRFVIGEVVLVHVEDGLWVGDHIGVSKFRPIGRLGEELYCRITDVFEMKAPDGF
jgi:flavin reductase (DIM6/NTAB) family NADH-FMN oxidoreductase RutF